MRLAAAALLALLAGCESGPGIVNPGPASKIDAVYPDLPTPPNFTYSENISDTSPTGAFRVVSQTLKGTGQTAPFALDFYKGGRFTGHGWLLESEEGKAPGPFKLAFTKKNERIRLEIREVPREGAVVVLKVNRKD